MALDKQVHVYSVDTSAFYYKDELEIHEKLNKLYIIRSKIIKKRRIIKKLHKKDNKKYENEFNRINKLYSKCNKCINRRKDKIYTLFKKNKGSVRELNPENLIDKNIVSIFDSTLTRVTNMKIDQLSNNLIIVQTYFFEILEDIILNGFVSGGEKYIVYTASAGQIRTKKTVFIKENLLKKYEKTLTCGLTDEVINKRGDININKYLAYRALQSSATDKWIGFDIDKVIVVNDFETKVKTMVDYIDDETYEIKRTEMEVPIPHTDGAGMMLPSFCNKNRMCRCPWIKGLLVVFDFKLFILEHIKNNPKCAIVKDIYGKEYDIIKDDIQVIFTESQFKMHKFYKDWNEYKTNFKKYNCQVGYCNEEEDFIKNARINYQMLQTLVDMTDEELIELSRTTNNDINKIATDKDTMLKLLGATKNNLHKNNLQKCIQYYPPLLNDTYGKNILKQVRKSLVKKGKSGKLSIDAKYTFLSPDLYAFCEWLFLGIKNPKGILKKEEVSCNLYDEGERLDCLRSPHLYMEHCVRYNKVDDLQKKWFVTKAIYTSCHDIISKILQFDVDGDKSLVCADKNIVSIAERNIKKMDIAPLYYNMKKAGSMKVDKETIFKGMIAAYKGGNIGPYSNDISKIWNGEKVDLDAIKLLCMENNFVIDYAKTLYKPKRPKWAKDKLTKYTKSKVPYFFINAKDKKIEQVESKNNSVVNRLNNIIKNPKLDIKSLNERFNYKKLMNNSKIEIKEEDKKIIQKYKLLDKKSTFMINNNEEYKHRIKNMSYEYKKIKEEILQLNNDEKYVTDILIQYLYLNKKDDKKVTLWECFGDVILENLIDNSTNDFKKEAIECEKCGILIEKKSNKTKYCKECAREIKLENDRRTQKNRYNSRK